LRQSPRDIPGAAAPSFAISLLSVSSYDIPPIEFQAMFEYDALYVHRVLDEIVHEGLVAVAIPIP
jgi:hypothetical protein